MADKNKLKNILLALSTDEEKAELLQLDKIEEVAETVNSLKEELKPQPVDLTEIKSEITSLKNRISNIPQTDLTPLIEAIKESIGKIPQPKFQDLSGFFKDLGTQLAQYGGSSKNTEELIRNLKWNSTMGIKNRDGSPISPAVSPFQIPDYDDIKLLNYDANNNPGLVKYYLGGSIIATLTLTYDGSGNLTEAKRT